VVKKQTFGPTPVAQVLVNRLTIRGPGPGQSPLDLLDPWYSLGDVDGEAMHGGIFMG